MNQFFFSIRKWKSSTRSGNCWKWQKNFCFIYRTEAKQFLMKVETYIKLMIYCRILTNFLTCFTYCLLVFYFLFSSKYCEGFGNYLVAHFLLTKSNAKFKKRLRLVRVPHCFFQSVQFQLDFSRLWYAGLCSAQYLLTLTSIFQL